mmetsp:Transcript_1813/g.2864  ORF Transcript_1813/g.2864 Transcript_1813/m.2864 type:complete len:204 (+) Transcript_1813:200-811(+)
MIRTFTRTCLSRTAHHLKTSPSTVRSPLYLTLKSRQFCFQSVSNEKPPPLYEGSFGGVLSILRRVSLGSATLSITTLPVMMMLYGTMPSVGQYTIVGTAVVMALGSTLFLKAMSYPYVIKLEEKSGNSDVPPEQRIFVATRLNMFGSEYETEFMGSDISPVTVRDHPFASFQVKGDHFFVFDKLITDTKVRKHFDFSDRKNEN